MVTSYYILKMCQARKNTHLIDYYKDNKPSNLKNNPCRICLNAGCVSIFENNNCTSDIINIIKNLCDIEIRENDKYKLLCKECDRFIKIAVLFKTTAKQTHDVLISAKEEIQYDDSHNFCDILEIEKESNQDDPKVKNKCKEITNDVEMTSSFKIQCEVCNTVVNKSYYKEHLTMHDPNHYKYICDVCGKSFRLRCSYYNHKLRHGSGFPYKCKICPYKGRYPELLKTHNRVHIGDYRYMCTECPARFLFKSNLNRHMFKHKEPEFKCDSCKRAFHTKLSMQRHFEADHLGIRNHVCSLCGKAFGYRNAMMKHQRHVHKREKCMFSRMPAYLQAEKVQTHKQK